MLIPPPQINDFLKASQQVSKVPSFNISHREEVNVQPVLKKLEVKKPAAVTKNAFAHIINTKKPRFLELSSRTPKDSLFFPKRDGGQQSTTNYGEKKKQKHEFNISINSNASSKNVILRDKFLEIYKKKE